jgi:hypothetical protein
LIQNREEIKLNISMFSDRLIAMVFLVLISQISGIATADQRTGEALEILISPGNGLIAQEARTPGLNYDGVSPYYDMVLQTVYVVNRGPETVTLQGGRIVVKSGERIIQTTALSMDEFARTSAKASAIKNMNFETGLQVLYSMLSTLPDGIDIAAGPELPASTAGLVDDYYLITRELPDAIHIEVWGLTPDGNRIEGTGSFPVSTHESANEYIFPLEAGEWFILAFPGLRGHHRWTAATEHGYDITMVDSRGSWASGKADAFRTGRVPRWEDWYAYNKKVLAAADGEVVEVSDDVEFPLSFWNWRDDETLEECRGRIGARQMELFMATDGTVHGARRQSRGGCRGQLYPDQACQWRIFILRTSGLWHRAGQTRAEGQAGRAYCRAWRNRGSARSTPAFPDI